VWEFYAWVYNALPRYVKHRGYFISQAFVSLREMRLWVTFNFMNKHFIATPAWIFAFYCVSFLSTLLLNNKLMKGTLGNFSTKTNRTRFWKVWHTFHSFLWDAIRGVTRLNGVRDEKQVWRPHVWCLNLRYFGSKCTVLKKVLVTFLELFSALRSHLTPHSDSMPGELSPFFPFVTPLDAVSARSWHSICW